MKAPYQMDSAGNYHYKVNGKYHREDGPALEYYGGGGGHWYINGKLHRIDGPAVDYSFGHQEYWLNGSRYSFEEWDRLRKLPWLL